MEEVDSAGWSAEGGIRGRLMELWQSTWLRLLKKAMEEHPDQSWRPVWSLPQLSSSSGDGLSRKSLRLESSAATLGVSVSGQEVRKM
jgi:hypothetical protein